MKITQDRIKEICRLAVKLRVMADDADDTGHHLDASAMRDAAFYLSELAMKHVWPEAQSLIEAKP